MAWRSATIARWNLTDQLYGHPNTRYDSRKFTALGSMNREAGTCFTWHTTGIDSIEAAMKREVLVGATGATGTSLQFPLLLNALIGTKFKPITGYPDSGAVGLAMERGELEGYCSFTWGSIKGARPQWIKEKLIAIILQLTLRKHPELPHVPLVMDYAKDEAARQAFALAFADQEIARPIVAPPDVPRREGGCTARGVRGDDEGQGISSPMPPPPTSISIPRMPRSSKPCSARSTPRRRR